METDVIQMCHVHWVELHQNTHCISAEVQKHGLLSHLGHLISTVCPEQIFELFSQCMVLISLNLILGAV